MLRQRLTFLDRPAPPQYNPCNNATPTDGSMWLMSNNIYMSPNGGYVRVPAAERARRANHPLTWPILPIRPLLTLTEQPLQQQQLEPDAGAGSRRRRRLR